MNRQILAIIIQEGGRLITEFTKVRPRKHEGVSEERLLAMVEPAEVTTVTHVTPTEVKEVTKEPVNQATAVPTGCIPCSLGHVGTCTGILNEARRFAQSDGMASSEVIDRVNICLDELNALEREDLRPQMLVQLDGWEKELANKVLVESRTIRHKLEGLKTLDELDEVAAHTQTTRLELGRSWFQKKLTTIPKEDKAKLVAKAVEKMEKES